MYEINFLKVHKIDAANLVQFPTGDGALIFWHRGLGHLNLKDIYIFQNMVSGMNLDKVTCPTFLLLCKACIGGKQHRAMFFNKGIGCDKQPNLLEIVIMMCVVPWGSHPWVVQGIS